jgi:hypothetical protein
VHAINNKIWMGANKLNCFRNWRFRIHIRSADATAGLIDESCGERRRLRPARRILQTTDRRLRGQWRAACRTAADRDLHEWIMPQPVEVDGTLVAAGNRRNARHHHLEHRVLDAIRIAPIRHRIGNPPAHPEGTLGGRAISPYPLKYLERAKGVRGVIGRVEVQSNRGRVFRRG